MPLYGSDTIEIWRSTTGLGDLDFAIVTEFADPGTPWTWTDPDVQSQHLYIYKSRRWAAATQTFSPFGPYIYARGPWPRGIQSMANTYVGIQSLMGFGREVNEGQPVGAQMIARRQKGSFDVDLQDPEVDELQYTDTTAIDSVPGVARIGPTPFDITITPEGLSQVMCMLFGDPITSAGGGTAPTAPVPTTLTVGGTIPRSTQVDTQVSYVRPTDWEQTTASATGSVTTGAGTDTNTVSVPSPGAQTGATGYHVYARVGSGTFTKQNAALIPIGTPFTMTAPPTTTGYPAPQAFNVHDWLGALAYIPHSLLEKRGPTTMAWPGCKADSFDFTVDKTQNASLIATVGLAALNRIVYNALTDVGLDAVGADPLKAFGPAQATATLGGVPGGDIKTLAFKIAKGMQPRDVLDGYRGAQSHFAEGNAYSGTLGAYFSTESEMNTYFGQLDSVAKPYGLSKNILTVPLVATLASQINGNGFRNKFIAYFPRIRYKKVGAPVAGKGAIMQAIDWVGYFDAATGSGCKLTIWNGQSHGFITTQGTPLSSVPVNDMTSFSA